MGELKQLKRSLRDISFFDIIMSKIFKCPATFGDNYCEPLSDSISEFLDQNPLVVSIDQHNMVLRNDCGKQIKFWVANYPYSYGSVDGFICKYLSWGVVLRLRKIHIMHKDEIISDFIKRNSI